MDESSKKLLSLRKATLLDQHTEQMKLEKDIMTVLHSDQSTLLLSRLLHVLVQNPSMQDRMHKEHCLALAFIREVLRLYASVRALLRCAIKDTVLPLESLIIGRDGHKTYLLIPNMSAQIWGEDVLEFKPERWLSPLPGTVVNSSLPGIYSHMMTFWGRSSACLGNIRSSSLINWFRFQFGLLELKVVILLLLSAFEFTLADREIVWRSSGLQFPSVAETGSLALPLNVEAL